MEPVNQGLKTQKPWVQIKLPRMVYSDNLSKRTLTETRCSKLFKYVIPCLLKIKSSSEIVNSSQYFKKKNRKWRCRKIKHCQENSASKNWSQMYHWGLSDVQPYNPSRFFRSPDKSSFTHKVSHMFFAICVLVSENLGGISRLRRDSIVCSELLESFFQCSLHNKCIVIVGANGRRVKNKASSWFHHTFRHLSHLSAYPFFLAARNFPFPPQIVFDISDSG